MRARSELDVNGLVIGHKSSCDVGGCVGCMGNGVVGQCGGGVELKGEWTQMWTCINFQLTSLHVVIYILSQHFVEHLWSSDYVHWCCCFW